MTKLLDLRFQPRRRGLAFKFLDESFRQGEQPFSLSLDFVDVLNDYHRALNRAVPSNDWCTQQGYPRLCAIRTQAERFFNTGLLSAQGAGKGILATLESSAIDSNRTPLRVVFYDMPGRGGGSERYDSPRGSTGSIGRPVQPPARSPQERS